MFVVTGSTGFVGNNLVRRLVSAGSGPVRALVRPTSRLTALSGLDVDIVRGNVLEPASLVEAFDGADTVFHVAGLVSITGREGVLLHETNVGGTRNVLSACERAGVRRLVYCSSIHAFAVPPAGTCITEETPVDPARCVGAYDRTKAEATLLVREAAARGLDAVVVFPTGIIGPHDFIPSLVGELLTQCACGRLPAYVDGGYDFVDVRDLAAGMTAASTKGRPGEGYILSGNQVGVRQLILAIEELTGTPAPRLRLPLGLVRGVSPLIPAYYRITKQRPLFTKYSLDVVASGCTMSSAKAERELGYRRRPFAETITDTVAWFREEGALQRAARR